MPKLRPSVEILKDAQRHLSVVRSRLLRERTNPDLLAKINDLMTKIDILAASVPQEEYSLSDKAISNAIDLINKEVKKPMQKIDLLAGIKAVYNATNGAAAMQIGLDHGFTQEQIKTIVQRTPAHTNLGKAIAKLKPKPIPTTPEPVSAVKLPRAPQPPQVFEDEDEITNNSDIENIPDDLKQLLTSGE